MAKSNSTERGELSIFMYLGARGEGGTNLDVLDVECDETTLGRLEFKAKNVSALCAIAAKEIAQKRGERPTDLHQSSKLWRALDDLRQARRQIDAMTKELREITGWGDE